MTLTGNACVRTGWWISQSVLVVPFVRFPAVILVALVLLIGSGCTLQSHRGNQVLNLKIPDEISAPVEGAASQGEEVVTPGLAAPGGGTEEAPTEEIAEESQENSGKQGEVPGALTAEPALPEANQAKSTGVAGGGAVFASLTTPISLPIVSAGVSGAKVGGPDPGFSEAEELSGGSTETEEVSSPAPAESTPGAGDLIDAIEAPALLVAQEDKEEKPEKSQDEAASSQPVAGDSSEETGTEGPPAGAEEEADPEANPTEEKPSRFPIGILGIFGVCLVLAIFQNIAGKRI